MQPRINIGWKRLVTIIVVSLAALTMLFTKSWTVGVICFYIIGLLLLSPLIWALFWKKSWKLVILYLFLLICAVIGFFLWSNNWARLHQMAL